MSSTMERTALSHAANGYRVFPVRLELKPNGKKLVEPHIRGYHSAATNDGDQISRWWSQWPDAAVGAVPDDDVFMLDFDPYHDGLNLLAALEAGFGELPRSRRHRSGRGDGGFHIALKRPDGVKLAIKGLKTWAKTHDVWDGEGDFGIDLIHGHHRFSFMPGTIHPVSGLPYEWETEPTAHIEDCPTWLAELLTKQPDPTPPKPTNLSIGDSPADRFTDSHTWNEILEPHRWELVDGDGDSDGSAWRHPTATSNQSATIKHSKLFVYSPNTPFDETEGGEPRGYTRFRAHAVLNHAGDLSEATRVINKEASHRFEANLPKREAPRTDPDEPVTEPDDQPNPMFERLYRGAELEALPDPVVLIPELLMRDSLAMTFGPSGVGKSFITMSMALSVASGRSWFGRKIEPGPVLYIAAEGVRGIKLRQRAWLDYHDVGDNDIRDMYWHRGAIDLRNIEQVERIADIMDDIGPRWVIFDTLNRCMPGGDENHPRDAGQVIAALSYLQDHGDDPCVSTVHHSGKDASKGARGHSLIKGAMDTEIEVAGGSGLIQIRTSKQKDDEEVGPLTYGLEQYGQSAVVVDRIAGAMKNRDRQILQALEDIDAGGGGAGGAWQEAAGEVGISPTSFKEARKRLMGNDYVRTLEVGGRYPPYQATEQGKRLLGAPRTGEDI